VRGLAAGEVGSGKATPEMKDALGIENEAFLLRGEI
jgi:hypothetical protein